MSLLSCFCEDLTKHLSRNSSENYKGSQKLIRFFEGSDDYDFSFPVALKIWNNYLKNITQKDIDENNDDIISYSAGSSENGVEQLKLKSSRWTFKIEKIVVKDHHYNLSINRALCFFTLIQQVMENPDYGKSEKDENDTISLKTEDDESNSVTQLRVDLLSSAIRNLIPYSKFHKCSSPMAKHKLLVTSKSMLSRNHPQFDRKLVVCRSVVNPVDKKTSTLCAHDYITKRCEDMHLTSVHKYGVRMECNNRFMDLVQRLGGYASTLNLLEVKHSSRMLLNPNTNQTFILYNSARMETLLEKFEKKVEEGYYQKLPALKQIDTTLLIEHEEWQIAKLLLTFPLLIDRSINELVQGKVSVHLLHRYLKNLANIFSIYYRRVRFLTENRPQLMPVLHAKVHLLQAIRKIFNITLAFFSIEPLQFM